MSNENKLVPCVGCGAMVPDTDGPTHRYIGASPGCWQIFTELPFGEDGLGTHRLTGDAYAAQHPGVPGKQSSQSVCAHLFVLCLALERDMVPAHATDAIRQFVNRYKELGLPWLEPPASLGKLTILDVAAATNREGRDSVTREWMVSVWQAWEPHHATIRVWADEWEKGNPP